jgi:hypothetical protein
MAAHGEALQTLTAAAKTDYPIFGFSRSYWDFHVGFGHMVRVTFLMEAALLWLLAHSVTTLSGASTRAEPAGHITLLTDR